MSNFCNYGGGAKFALQFFMGRGEFEVYLSKIHKVEKYITKLGTFIGLYCVHIQAL